MKFNTRVLTQALVGSVLVLCFLMGGVGCCLAAEAPVAGTDQRGEAIRQKIDAQPDAGRRDAARVRFNAYRMIISSANEVERTHIPGYEGLAPLAATQLDQIEKILSGNAAADAQPLVIEQGPFLGMVNQKVGLLFTVTDAGADLRAVYHPGKDFQFIRWVIGNRPLWAIRYYKDGLWPKTINSTHPAAVDHNVTRHGGDTTLTINWKFIKPYQTDLKMTVRLPADSALSEWALNVDHHDPGIGLGQVEFPLVRGVGLEDDSCSDFLAVPMKNGWLFYGPGRNASFGEAPNMGYMCYYTKDHAGLYFAAKDTDRNNKELMGLADSGTTALGVSYLVAGVGKTPIQLTYKGTIGVFTGDWFDGSLIYREWALKQEWAPKQNYLDRDLPQWYKEHSLCIRAQGDPASQMPMLRKIKARLGDIPAIVQWYGLFGDPAVKPSGQDLEKFPDINGRPGLKEAVAELNKMGLYVAEAYHEPMLWAEDSKTYKPMNGEAAAIRDTLGNIVYARFFGFPLTCACPSQESTQKVMIDATLQMVRDYGVKGIYADLCGTYGSPCYAENHGHTIGGGNWAPEGQRIMLKKMSAEARKLEPDFTIMVENMDERMMDSFDSYISFHGINPDFQINVPMLHVVYGDRILSGAAKSAGITNGAPEEASLAQVFVWGDIIGRYWDSIIEDKGREAETAQWMKLAHYHHAAIKWFLGGRMLRPLALQYEPSPGTGATSEQELMENRFAVQEASHKATDGTVLFAFCSSRLNKTKTLSYTIDPAEYGVPGDGSWTLYQMDEDGKLQAIGPITGKLERKETFPPRGVLMLVAKPTGDKS